MECVKNLKGTVLLILEEIEDEKFLCVFPDGTKRLMEESKLDWDSHTEYESYNERVTTAQYKAYKEANNNEIQQNYDQFKQVS